MRGDRRYRRSWLAALLGFFLVGAGWALAAPYDGAPDERDHIVRAYGVITGQVVLRAENASLGGGGYVDAPRSLVLPRCWRFHPDRDASCAGSPGTDETERLVATSAGRNAPVYYAIVGAPIAVAPNWTGVILARLLSVLLCGLLLANALADAMRWSRHRMMVAGVLAGTTPMVLHLVGSVNPNSLELAASIAFFAAAVPLLRHPDARRDGTLLWHAGVAAAALATTRMLGPLWLALGVLVLLPWRWAGLRDLWAWRRLRRWAYAVAAAGAAGIAWTLSSGGAESNPYFQPEQPLSPLRVAWTELQNWSRYVDEMVGVFSWLDARLPALGYVVWPIVGGALVLSGFVIADRGNRLRLAALAGAGVLVPLSISAALANTFGFITQGRYLLPVLVGVPILAAFVLAGRLGAQPARSALRLTAVALLPIQFVALAFTMQRWQAGQGVQAGFDLLSAPWQPPLGPVVPLVAALAGLAVIGALCWTGHPGRDGPDDPGNHFPMSTMQIPGS